MLQARVGSNSLKRLRLHDSARITSTMMITPSFHRIHAFHEFCEQIPFYCIPLVHFPILGFRVARSVSSARRN